MSYEINECMQIELIRASVEDAQYLWEIQVKAFQPLLDKYKDFDTSPANEHIDKMIARLEQEETYYYFICIGSLVVGAIRVVDFQTETKKRISPLFVLPEYQNRGIVQSAIKLCEQIHGSDRWELSTILQEKGNCYLYEKLGYTRIDKQEKISDQMTLVFYEK